MLPQRLEVLEAQQQEVVRYEVRKPLQRVLLHHGSQVDGHDEREKHLQQGGNGLVGFWDAASISIRFAIQLER